MTRLALLAVVLLLIVAIYEVHAGNWLSFR